LSQGVDRRATLGLFAAAAALAGAQPSAEAAYGDAARVFAGKITNKSGENLKLVVQRMLIASQQRNEPPATVGSLSAGIFVGPLVLV
jgi:hypothetical protein